MRIVKPSAKLLTDVDGAGVLKRLELFGRVCYKSETKISDGSAEKFVRMIIKRGHHSVLEHISLSARFICDRGVSHEIVRHRLASYSQESTRYCNYGNNDEIQVIEPPGLKYDPDTQTGLCDTGTETGDLWVTAVEMSERVYLHLIERGVSPQIARSVLPNSLKTELVMTANLREWRHFFTLRTAPVAHPQMREVAKPLLAEMRAAIPVVFDDVGRV